MTIYPMNNFVPHYQFHHSIHFLMIVHQYGNKRMQDVNYQFHYSTHKFVSFVLKHSYRQYLQYIYIIFLNLEVYLLIKNPTLSDVFPIALQHP